MSIVQLFQTISYVLLATQCDSKSNSLNSTGITTGTIFSQPYFSLPTKSQLDFLATRICRLILKLVKHRLTRKRHIIRYNENIKLVVYTLFEAEELAGVSCKSSLISSQQRNEFEVLAQVSTSVFPQRPPPSILINFLAFRKKNMAHQSPFNNFSPSFARHRFQDLWAGTKNFPSTTFSLAHFPHLLIWL